MLLAIDIGNTNITFGVYKDKKLKGDFRIETDRNKMVDDYGILITNLLNYNNITLPDIEAVIVCSVVPPIMPNIKEMIRKYFNKEPLIVGENIKVPLKILYKKKEEVGSDRLINAVAAYRKYCKYKKPIVVVDFGTATTFDVISKEGAYLGGAIAPGFLSSINTLFTHTAKLPRIEIKQPDKVIGKTTVESMQSGIFYGFVEEVDGIIRRIEKELNSSTFNVATGGLVDLITPATKKIRIIDKFLTLDGLMLSYYANWKNKKSSRETTVSN